MSQPENIKIHPLQPHELDAFINLYCTTFSDPAADMIMPSIYPMGLYDPQVRKRLRAGLEPSYEKDKQYMFLAKDAQTDEILALSWWHVEENEEESSSADMHEEMEKAWNSRPTLPEVPGMNGAVARAYFERSFAARFGLPRLYMELSMLAVHPEHKGRGIGGMLLREGLKTADDLGLPVFVISSMQGKPMYERHGFGDVRHLPLDCREYGGVSEGKHWTLWRPARQ